MRGLYLLFVWAIALGGISCTAEKDESVMFPFALKRAEDAPEWPVILGMLKSESESVRSEAFDWIRALAKSELTGEQVAELVQTAADGIPGDESAFMKSDSRLIRAAAPHMKEEHVDSLVAAYPKVTEDGRSAIVAALARIGETVATQAYVDVLREYGSPAQWYPTMTSWLQDEPRDAEILFPPLLDGSIANLPPDVAWLLFLDYAKAGALTDALIEQARPVFLVHARQLLAREDLVRGGEGTAWRWAEEYNAVRYDAGLLFDVLGYVGRSDAVVDVLMKADATIPDPRPRLFALASLVRLGEEPSASSFGAVASDFECRITLFRALSELGRLDLFPESESAQEKLAESELVNWLIFPTELGKAPDAVELMKTLETPAGPDNDLVIIYVFRFKAELPQAPGESFWMAGIAGPYPKADIPTANGGGYTFSGFTPWEEMSADEHLAELVSDLANIPKP